jgi:hypothetical protein
VKAGGEPKAEADGRTEVDARAMEIEGREKDMKRRVVRSPYYATGRVKLDNAPPYHTTGHAKLENITEHSTLAAKCKAEVCLENKIAQGRGAARVTTKIL